MVTQREELPIITDLREKYEWKKNIQLVRRGRQHHVIHGRNLSKLLLNTNPVVKSRIPKLVHENILTHLKDGITVRLANG